MMLPPPFFSHLRVEVEEDHVAVGRLDMHDAHVPHLRRARDGGAVRVSSRWRCEGARVEDAVEREGARTESMCGPRNWKKSVTDM